MTALPPVVGVLTDHQIFDWWGYHNRRGITMPNKYPIGLTQKTVKNDHALRFWQPAHTFSQHDFFNQTDISEYPFCAKMIGLALAIQCRTNINLV